MKAFKTVLKVLAVLAAIGGAVYVGMTYGDKIVEWVKKVLRIDIPEGECCCDEDCCEEDCCCDGECCCEDVTEEAAEEAEEKDFEG